MSECTYASEKVGESISKRVCMKEGETEMKINDKVKRRWETNKGVNDREGKKLREREELVENKRTQ